MKVAVVTGSNKGIGLALVEKLAEFYKSTGGWHVFLTARDEQRGHRACEQLHRKGLPVKHHQLDICDGRSRKRFVDFVTSEYAGGINVLVNNAGILYKVNFRIFKIFARRLDRTNPQPSSRKMRVSQSTQTSPIHWISRWNVFLFLQMMPG
ncbi:hypothetical protein CRM22_006723 [Opisthorchis felineus]|uniref:Carbonyl reductase 1 n=1 Tax=Opisthorchis felineus TaxID=147828 RepID=A0A4S2LJH7_OPIFE|nr:hypothetical protein CRM22_006723 [Opisthorchis felineus]